MAAAFYKLIKILEYETANPGQDDSQEDAGEKSAETDTPHQPIASTMSTLAPIPQQHGDVGDSTTMERDRQPVFQTTG